jgi:putative component of membrane protein insertase Oxa1/YidC/SpoIIIJ protein YidD
MTVVFVLGSELREFYRSYNNAISSNFAKSCSFATCNDILYVILQMEKHSMFSETLQ